MLVWVTGLPVPWHLADGPSPLARAYQIPTASLAPGEHEARFRVTDEFGLSSEASVQFRVTVPVRPTSDFDGDGVADVGDNCAATINGDQADRDRDGAGDACQQAPIGMLPAASGRPLPDADADGVWDGADNCVTVPNPDQLDADRDQAGDACDDDVDGDGVLEQHDNCPTVPNPTQRDANGNQVGEACETLERLPLEERVQAHVVPRSRIVTDQHAPGWAASLLAAVVTLAAILTVALWRQWRVLAVILFSRLTRSDVVEKPERAKLLALVQASPGLHLLELARRSGLGRSAARHDLAVLERNGLVRGVASAHYRSYYPAGPDAGPISARRPLVRSEVARRALDLIGGRPGLTIRDVAMGIGSSYGQAAYQVRKLRDAGLVDLRLDGTALRAFARQAR